MRKINLRVLILLASLLLAGVTAYGQGTAFTYQGKLTDNGNAANGQYDFQFKLFDALSSGTQIGSTLTFDGNAGNQPFVVVANGIFTVQLDFGACPTCFNGAARFLEMAVKVHGGGAFPAPLSPRQPITSMPYAVKSLNAATADGLTVACVNCVTSSQIASVSGGAVTGEIPIASVPAGSGNYIQNQNGSTQTGDFNISGNGTASGTLSGSIVNAGMRYHLNGLRVFTVTGPFNNGTTIFTASNTFTGEGAGLATTPDPTLSSFNGKFNSFFGAGAGQANTTGLENAFFGAQAGQVTTTGNFNSFFGYAAGQRNTSGGQNTFFGRVAGFNNTTGLNNTFIGLAADFDVANPTGNNNTLLGASSRVTSGVSNATAIGFRAQVSQSNALVLGSINGVNSATADTNVGIGTPAPAARLHVVGNGLFTGDLTVNGTLTANIPRRKYYMTSATPAGNAVLTACVAGYHMASLAEIFNTSVLEYAMDLVASGDAHTFPDSGSGPPFSTLGFIRVGVTGSNNAVPGNANCTSGGGNVWSTNSAAVNGTAIALNPVWTGAPTNISPWDATVRPCSNTTSPVAHVWCVQN